MTYSSYLKKAAEDAEKKNKKASRTAPDVMTEAELQQALAEIDNRYVVSVDGGAPEGTRYDRIEYDPPTDAAIYKQAEDELAGYRAEGERDLREDAEKRTEDALERKEQSYRTLKDTESDVREDYENAVRAYEDDMAKRGLSRSSIAASERSAIERNAADSLAAARGAHAEKLGEIDAEISGLEADMEKALNAFNIAYAAKLTERIAELTAEREEKRIEALKYNNQMTEKEREELVEAAGGDASSVKPGEVPESLLPAYYREKYEAIREYLSGMDAEQAKVTVRNDPLIRGALSDYYYYTLYREFSGEA